MNKYYFIILFWVACSVITEIAYGKYIRAEYPHWFGIYDGRLARSVMSLIITIVSPILVSFIVWGMITYFPHRWRVRYLHFKRMRSARRLKKHLEDKYNA